MRRVRGAVLVFAHYGPTFHCQKSKQAATLFATNATAVRFDPRRAWRQGRRRYLTLTLTFTLTLTLRLTFCAA